MMEMLRYFLAFLYDLLFKSPKYLKFSESRIASVILGTEKDPHYVFTDKN